MNIYKEMQLVCAKLGKAELLAGLAEEAAELAQAALKYRRAIDGTNPTPKSEAEALAALYEEIADVTLYLGFLGLIADVAFYSKEPADFTVDKLKRWMARLEEVAS